MRPLKKLLLFSLIFLGIYRFCQLQTDGFSIARIQSDLINRSEWQTPFPEAARPILNQPFYYLGKGAQAFAFASQDGRYVLKFYRHHRAGHPLGFLAPILPRLKQTIEKRKNRRLRDFSSYKLAVDLLTDETGLIYIHLNKTNELSQKLTIYDKIGIKHILDLDNMEFILQRRASPFYSTFEKWISEAAFEKAEQGLTELVALLRTRCIKGIFDKDPDLKTNFGFINQTPIQFDVGRFSIDPSRANPEQYRDELIRITDSLKLWLDERSPRLSNFLEQELRKSS